MTKGGGMDRDDLHTAEPAFGAGETATAQYQLCEQCGAPLDEHQRYCVHCGSRRADAHDPAARYFATAVRRARSERAGTQSESSRASAPLVAGALVLAILPVAVGIGVLVGRNGGGTDSKLLAALRAQGPAVAAPTGLAAGGSTLGTTGVSLPSDFSLPRGYAVQLQTLPQATTDQAAVANAKRQAQAKGAAAVGLINPRDFKVTPDPGPGQLVLYDGQYTAKAAASRELARVRKRFPGARVILVRAIAATAAAAPVLAHTSFGDVHAVTGFKPSAQKIQSDNQVVQRINRQVGKSYVNAQKGLPDTIVVSGNAGSSPAPTGPGP
jgi:hypothetical protein